MASDERNEDAEPQNESASGKRAGACGVFRRAGRNFGCAVSRKRRHAVLPSAKEEWVNPFLKALKTICFAESLGGVESFITYPATQTHMDIPEEIRIANGVCNRLLRFSVGIEHAEDLKEDLKQALCQVKEGAVSFE